MRGVKPNDYRTLKYREVGEIYPPLFTQQIYSSEQLVSRLSKYGTLTAHRGCVNTVQFTSSGDHLLSGSDDRKIIIWDWARKKPKFSYSSGHHGNVFQAKPMPFTNDSCIVSCAADGEVRVGYITEGSSSNNIETSCLAEHSGRAHKLAIEPGNSFVFFSCGEDGIVRQFDLRDQNTSKRLFQCKSSTGRKRPIPLNSIALNPLMPVFFAVGGSEEYVRVYDRRNATAVTESGSDSPPSSEPDPILHLYAPKHLRSPGRTRSHITCAVYNYNGEELLATYNDEKIYLFDVQQHAMAVGDAQTEESEDKQEEEEEEEEHSEEEEEESDSPNGKNEQKLKKKKKKEEEEVKIKTGGDDKTFLQQYEGHRNSDTVKGVNFFGPRSEFVVTGSDCGHIFLWDKKTAKLVNMMKGDRRVVNCLEPHPSMPVLATSGIDNDVKIWTPTALAPASLDVAQEVIRRNTRARNSGSRHLELDPQMLLRLLRLQGWNPGGVVGGGGSGGRSGGGGGSGGGDEDEDEDDLEDGGDGQVECRTS
jgi:WD repeat-containing protein 42A